MTFAILNSVKLGKHLRELKQFKDAYVSHGVFYEHAKNTVGFDFKQNELEKFIIMNRVDPAVFEGEIPTNYSNYFAGLVGEKKLICFEMENTYSKESIIGQSYLKFEVFMKK